MSRTSNILTTTVLAAAVSIAVIGSAFAQAAAGGGGGAPGGAPGPGPSSGGGSGVIVYGTPGNCPPTMAGCNQPEKPKVVKMKKIERCGDYPAGSAARRECLAAQ